LDHFLFPIWGILMKTLQTKSVNGQRFHRGPTAVLYCFEEYLMDLIINLLLAESGTICLLYGPRIAPLHRRIGPINSQLSTDFESWLVTRSPA
jgi:hypothetical protein